MHTESADCRSVCIKFFLLTKPFEVSDPVADGVGHQIVITDHQPDHADRKRTECHSQKASSTFHSLMASLVLLTVPRLRRNAWFPVPMAAMWPAGAMDAVTRLDHYPLPKYAKSVSFHGTTVFYRIDLL